MKRRRKRLPKRRKKHVHSRRRVAHWSRKRTLKSGVSMKEVKPRPKRRPIRDMRRDLQRAVMAWNRQADKRIKEARRSQRLTGEDMQTRINCRDFD